MAALAVIFTASVSFAQTLPSHDGYVTDEAGILTAQQEQQLEVRIREIETTIPSHPQIAIVIPRSLNGREPAQYANDIGEAWGVGQRGTDNGVVILLAPKERQVFIAPATGLQSVLTDGICGRIIDTRMAEHLKRGHEQWYEALLGAVNGVQEEIVREPSASQTAASVEIPPLTIGVFIAGVIVTIIAACFGVRQGGTAGLVSGLALGAINAPFSLVALLVLGALGLIGGLALSGLILLGRNGEWGGGISYYAGSSSSSSRGNDDDWPSGSSSGGFGGFGGGGGFSGGGGGRRF